MLRNNESGRDEENGEKTPQTAASEQDSGEDSSRAGRGWHGDPEGHAAAGRKGGEAVSRDRDHMAAIGQKGGKAVSRNRDHMAAIGRKGGQARGRRSTPSEDENNS